MIKAILVFAVILQIIVAVQSEGLARSLAELTAFLLVCAFVFNLKASKRSKLQGNIDNA